MRTVAQLRAEVAFNRDSRAGKDTITDVETYNGLMQAYYNCIEAYQRVIEREAVKALNKGYPWFVLADWDKVKFDMCGFKRNVIMRGYQQSDITGRTVWDRTLHRSLGLLETPYEFLERTLPFWGYRLENISDSRRSRKMVVKVHFTKVAKPSTVVTPTINNIINSKSGLQRVMEDLTGMTTYTWHGLTENASSYYHVSASARSIDEARFILLRRFDNLIYEDDDVDLPNCSLCFTDKPEIEELEWIRDTIEDLEPKIETASMETSLVIIRSFCGSE